VSTAPELKPCPWCGQTPRVQHKRLREIELDRVRCNTLDCPAAPCVESHTPELAIAAWNRRAVSSQGEGPHAACLEAAAHVCESMVVGGRAWTEGQAIAADALFAAAKNIRALPAPAPGGPGERHARNAPGLRRALTHIDGKLGVYDRDGTNPHAALTREIRDSIAYELENGPLTSELMGTPAAPGQTGEVERCEATGNPCGTDTWGQGYECMCRPCQRMVSASRPAPPTPEPTQPDARCERCGWPLAKSRDEGCVLGDCSYRPPEGSDEYYRMKRIDEERAARRAGDAQAGKERT